MSELHIRPAYKCETLCDSSHTCDASAITELIIQRKFDADPWEPELNQQRISWFAEHGNAANQRDIDLATIFPTDYFVHVATLGGLVVGYLKGASILKRQGVGPFGYVDHGGLMVREGYDGQGIAQELEDEFTLWAIQHRRPVCVRVAIGNERAHNFFEKQGYTYDQTLPETKTGPALDVLILSRERLSENYDQYREQFRLPFWERIGLQD